MAIIRTKGSAKLTWATELVDDPDGGNFYMKVYPKLTDFKVARDPARLRQVAKEVLEEIKWEAKRRKTGNTKVQ